MFNGALGLFTLLLGIVISSLLGRIRRLESDKTDEKVCLAKHQLDEERIANLMIRTNEAEARNSSDHGELKDQLATIYKTLSSVQRCVYQLAGVDRRADKEDFKN